MADCTETCIELKQVSFSRRDKPVLRRLSLAIPRGKLTAIMGPSGTGKTTILRLIGGELKPDAGEIRVNDLLVNRLSQRKLYQLRRQMGVLFQQGALFTDMNVFDNVAFPLQQHTKLSSIMIRDLVLMMLEAVGLRGAAYLNIDELSGGMARRVALARSIIMGPEIMLYDEPFSGQDPIVRGVLLKLIRELNDAFQMTSILITHDVHEAAQIADFVYIISGGKVIAASTPEALLKNTEAEVQQFVKGLADGPVAFRIEPPQSYAEELGLC